MAAPTLLEPVDGPHGVGPRDRHQAWWWLGAAAAGVVVGAAMATILASVGAAIAGTPGGASAIARRPVPPVWFVVAELVGLWVGFLGTAFVVTRSGRRLGFVVRAGDARYVVLGLALQLAIFLCYLPFPDRGHADPVHHLLGGGAGWLLVVPACLTVFVAPVVEELYFRGVLLRAFLGLITTRVAIVGVVLSVALDAVLFGAAHLGVDSWIQLPGLVATGAVLAVLAVRSGRLGPSIVTHVSFNAAAVVWFAVRR